MKDFFISYNRADRAWAEWIARELQAAGFSVVSQFADFGPGSNFVVEMDRATQEAERLLAVLSPAYLAATIDNATEPQAIRDYLPRSDRARAPHLASAGLGGDRRVSGGGDVRAGGVGSVPPQPNS
jgi:hypothetical protein